MRRPHLYCWVVLLSLSVPEAQAQFAVVDIAAINQLIAQVRVLQDQLTTARNHLAQAQAEFTSITGGRGMERLLADTHRNYLPRSWAELQGVMQSGGGAFGALSGGVAASVADNSILPPAALELLPADVREQIRTSRQLTALRQNLTRQALVTSSNRFAELQQLIQAIPAAADQKAVLDLQARVNAETTMLQNEQSKLLTLFQVVQAEQQANQQQMRERALVGQGQFAARFQPAP